MTFFNRVVFVAMALTGWFFAMRGWLGPDRTIVMLNGLFAGSMVAIVVAYHRLIWFAMLGRGEYDRVRQMTLGFAVCWAAVCVGVANSVMLRASGGYVPTSELTAVARYLAIIAAILQVTAPDFGLGLFHGRDRRVLWTGGTLGLISAALVIALQEGALP
jgi:hypothetical protein